MKDQKQEKIEIKKQLEKNQKELEENTDMLKRLQAEFENHIKRTEKEKSETIEFANANLIKKFLPVIDDFENTLKHLEDLDSEIKDGIKMLFNNFMNILKEQGLKEIKTDKLDPFLHEVMQQKQSNEPEGAILEEVQKGYELKGKVIRPSKVIVSKNKDSKEEN